MDHSPIGGWPDRMEDGRTIRGTPLPTGRRQGQVEGNDDPAYQADVGDLREGWSCDSLLPEQLVGVKAIVSAEPENLLFVG